MKKKNRVIVDLKSGTDYKSIGYNWNKKSMNRGGMITNTMREQ